MADPQHGASRIVFTPYQEVDGQWRTPDELVSKPDVVEIDGNWIHIVTYEPPLNARRVLRSHPARVIDCIIWEAVRGD